MSRTAVEANTDRRFDRPSDSPAYQRDSRVLGDNKQGQNVMSKDGLNRPIELHDFNYGHTYQSCGTDYYCTCQRLWRQAYEARHIR